MFGLHDTQSYISSPVLKCNIHFYNCFWSPTVN